jgi:hypothetical protein
LTEDQKKAKLEELRERLLAKKAAQADKDKEDAKRNEVTNYSPSTSVVSLSNTCIENKAKVYKGNPGGKGRPCTQGTNQGGNGEAQGEA